MIEYTSVAALYIAVSDAVHWSHQIPGRSVGQSVDAPSLVIAKTELPEPFWDSHPQGADAHHARLTYLGQQPAWGTVVRD
jgi:hypothetical protein